MTADEEKDPPVPAYLEGISLKRVHDGRVVEEKDTEETGDADDTGSGPTSGQDV
ncbi:hypothetical protein [Arthrobacter sp. SX1312]|uniref:hypothetical protein n=1 Tax=Arthrobacter sp. SX1312 TaxID=2058896 RepID=UPI0015E22F15|nr:hypothetical protein [Arthrobacter sp. SX1312]